MANRRFNQFFYTFERKPVLLSCNFIVDSTNGNGLGQRSLKGAGIQNVFMHTSATPAPGSPNPAAGIIMVQLQDNYAKYLGGFSGQVSALSGTPISSGMTVGVPYVIVSLGASTLAQWQAAGVPSGVVPSVGLAFIATATSVAGGGVVEASVYSGVDHIEVVGDANQSIESSAGSGAVILGLQSSAYLILQCFNAGAVAAPVAGSVIGLSFLLSNSSITQQGE